MRSRVLRVIGSSAAAIGVLLGSAWPAAADNTLESSDPADGAVLTAPPRTVVLTFAERLDPSTTTVTVKGPGLETLSDQVSVEGTTATAAVAPGPDGEYRVNYRVNSADGHPVADSIRFTVAPAGAASASASTTAAVATVAGQEESGDTVDGWWVWLIAGAVTALAAIAIVVAVRRDRATT